MREGLDRVADGGSEWSLSGIQKILWGRRWLVLAFAVEVFLIVALVTFLKTPLYEASSRIVIERSMPKVMQGEDVVPTVWNEFEIQRFYQTQYLLLQDPALIRAALDRHGVRESITQTLSRPEADEARPVDIVDDARIAEYIKKNLKVSQVEYSNIVRVSFRHPSAQVAADVVNAVVENYRDHFVNSGLDARKTASKFLKEAIDTAQAEVRDIERKLADARAKFTTTTTLPSTGDELGKSRLESLDAELTGAKARLAKAEAQLQTYRTSPPDGIDEVRNNPQVQKYNEDLAALRKKLAEIEGKVGPNWPALRELKTAISETQANLDREERRIYGASLQSARADAERERRTVERFTTLLESELGHTAKIKETTGDFDSLQQEYDQKKAALDRLLARRDDVAVATNLKDVVERQVTIVDAAVPPESPAVPRTKLNLALGLALGLFVGLCGAFIAEALDNKIRSGAQLSEMSRLPLLGSIPRLEGPSRPRLIFSRRKKGGGASPMMAARQHDVEEAFRALRSSLLLTQAGRPPRVLLVTSALPGEGKSTIAANLGRTLASFGHRTALIDCDLRHPRLHRVFKARPDRGLTNVLAQNMSVRDVLQPTQFDNLDFVPGGPCPPDPATLLDPERVRAAVDELLEGGGGHEFVIIDTPPVMVFADTYNLLPVVEGVVLVARAQVTPKDALRQTHEALRKVNAPLLGVVLNGEISEEHSGSYYRYYHYRRGYYRKSAEARRAGAEAAAAVADEGTGPEMVTGPAGDPPAKARAAND